MEPLIYSDLGGPLCHDGQDFEINIYRLPNSDWVVEVSGAELSEFTLDEFYPTEESAYSAALDAIRELAANTRTASKEKRI